MKNWLAPAGLAIAGTLALAVVTDRPAAAQTSKELVLQTQAGRASSSITSVIAGSTPGTYWVLIVGSGAARPACNIATPTMGEALQLRAQIVDGKTTSVECIDGALKSGSVNITSPMGANQSWRVNGSP